MRWLSRLLATLLALTVVAAVGAWVLNQTLWNQAYLRHKAEQVNLAGQLAPKLPAALTASLGLPADTEVMLASVLTPAYLQGQVDTLLVQLQRYYHGDGGVPQLDLSDLSARLPAAGFEPPPILAATLNQPHPLTAGQADSQIKQVVRTTQDLVWLAPMAAVLMIGLIVLVAGHRRWLTLAGATLGAALGLLGLAAAAYIPPRLVSSMVATSAAADLTIPLRSYAEAVMTDQLKLLLWTAAVLAVIALALVSVHLIVKVRHRFQPTPHH